GSFQMNRPAPHGTPSTSANACTASRRSRASNSIDGRTPCSSTKTVQRRRRQVSTSAGLSARRTWIMFLAEPPLGGHGPEDDAEQQEEPEREQVAVGQRLEQPRAEVD